MEPLHVISSIDRFKTIVDSTKWLNKNLPQQNKVAIAAKVNDDCINFSLLFKDPTVREICQSDFTIKTKDFRTNLDVLFDIMAFLPKLANKASEFIYKLSWAGQEEMETIGTQC